MKADKACPVVLRCSPAGRVALLVFEHPQAGIQLVKGGVEPGESGEQAALRELAEESGIAGARCVRPLGVWASGHQRQVWTFHECSSGLALPDTWIHHTADDGGHAFRFFWHPLDETPSDAWHPVFQRAWAFIRGAC